MTAILRALIVVGVLVSTSHSASAATLEPLGKLNMEGDWVDGENFSAALFIDDVLVIASDEKSFLQFGRRSSKVDTYEWAGRLALTEEGKPAKVELDIEALARSGNFVYALGAHSATRKRADKADEPYTTNRGKLAQNELNPPRELLHRFTFDPAAGTSSNRESVSLRPAIGADAILSRFLSIPSKENGIDLEGLAVDGTTLYAGFRGPVLRHGFVPVLRFEFDDPKKNELLLVPLDGRGIRDLVRVSDGFLVLAGPVGDSDQSHRVYWWNGQDCVPGTGGKAGRLQLLGEVPFRDNGEEGPAQKIGKAEALVVTAEKPAEYTFVLFYDSLEKGAPERFGASRSATDPKTPSTTLCGQGS